MLQVSIVRIIQVSEDFMIIIDLSNILFYARDYSSLSIWSTLIRNGVLISFIEIGAFIRRGRLGALINKMTLKGGGGGGRGLTGSGEAR